MYLLFLFVTLLLLALLLYMWGRIIEYIYCVVWKRQVPFVACSFRHKRAIVAQIKQFYPNAKSVVEVGSGDGALARYVARHTKARVYALENMPFCIFLSRIGDFFCFAKSKTVWCDAFEYLDKTDKKFDIAVAYLGPKLTPKLKKYNKKIKVLITMNFEIPDLTPVRTVNLKHGSVTYNGVKYPHKLFVYEL